MKYLSLPALEAAQVSIDPYEHFLIANVLKTEHADDLRRDYPEIAAAGSFSLADAHPGPAVQALIDELESDEVRAVFAAKFGVDLDARPTVTTLRGRCSPRDGKIHTDSKSKILTVLIYFNEPRDGEEGVLRLLRDGHDIDNYAATVPPTFGSLLAFKRSDTSFHGHLPFEGPRRVLQFNYVRSEGTTWVSQLRHRLSAVTKRAASGKEARDPEYS